jgi:hypothetical protein
VVSKGLKARYFQAFELEHRHPSFDAGGDAEA